MPKKIITNKTLPLILNELDKWQGKLTWDLYIKKLTFILSEKYISRHTLLSYPVIVEAFNNRKNTLKNVIIEKKETDLTLDFAKEQISMLKAKVQRLEQQNELLLEQFVRWQHNAYMMPGINMKDLNCNLDKPLPKVNKR